MKFASMDRLCPTRANRSRRRAAAVQRLQRSVIKVLNDDTFVYVGQYLKARELAGFCATSSAAWDLNHSLAFFLAPLQHGSSVLSRPDMNTNSELTLRMVDEILDSVPDRQHLDFTS